MIAKLMLFYYIPFQLSFVSHKQAAIVTLIRGLGVLLSKKNEKQNESKFITDLLRNLQLKRLVS